MNNRDRKRKKPAIAKQRRSVGCGWSLSHTNRFGNTYYLHQGATKTGKPRYFVARSIEMGALSAMPASPASFALRIADLQARAHYTPVTKFVPAGVSTPGDYMAYRISYRGKGGWWPLAPGRLSKLLQAYVRHIGTDEFFELL